MALVRIPFIGLIFRPFVEQEISRECLLGLLKQINPERNFDGELMIFGAMNTRDIQARYDFLIKVGYKSPSSGEEADMAFSFGPRTSLGRISSAQARLVHGRETREIRKNRSDKFKEMKTLYELYLKNC